jgi:hypothetical protein
VWGIIHSGQSWSEGSLTVSDTWTTPVAGWDGHVDRENATNSGEHNSLTREFLPGVFATRNQDTNADIGILSIQTNNFGNISAADSHKTGGGETTDWGMMKHLISDDSVPPLDWVLTKAYSGGNTLAALSAETSPAPLVQALKSKSSASITFYEELLQSVVYARDYARSKGQEYRVAAFLWQQGHSDMTNASYATAFLTYYDKLNAAVKRITGQADDVICLIPQINYSTNGTVGRTNLGTSIDQKLLDILDSRGTRPIYGVGPMYQITNFIHCYRAGYRWVGEIVGKILKRILFDGVDWQPVRPHTFTKAASYVDIDFYVPVGSLQFVDTNENNIEARVTHNGVDTYGFEYSKAEGTATITIDRKSVV